MRDLFYCFLAWLDGALATVWGKILFVGGIVASLFWVFTEPRRERNQKIASKRASQILDEIERIHNSCLKDHIKVDQIHDCIHELTEITEEK